MSGSPSPADDLRHRPEPGGRMRDSLFWQLVLPEEDLAVQIYLVLTGSGRIGCTASAWGSGDRPLAVERWGGRIGEDEDLDRLEAGPLRLRQPEPLRSAHVVVAGERLDVDLAFTGLHDAFSYWRNPDGLPRWFAADRIEQAGRLSGTITIGSRRIAVDATGHRDHSWGVRDWRAPQHWTWFAASLPDGTAVNGWLWRTREAHGCAGFVARAGHAVPIASIDADLGLADDGRHQRRLAATLHDVDGGRTAVELDVFGLLDLPDERTGTLVIEGACRARIDGVEGAGQLETEWTLE